MMQLSQVSNAVNGQLHGNDVFLKGAVIDSRGDCSDCLFVALDGERFDGHNFIRQAEDNGAVATIVEHRVDSSLPSVQVADSFQALKDLAAWWRAQFVLPVIGITGSVGKTSVKEMLASIFAGLGKGLVTHGNLNNEIGVPLTLMRLASDDQYAVIEMGMNHAGEIERLTNITKPTVALINNAAAAHLEGLGSIEAVAAAKGEIFSGLSDDGVAVINADDRFAPLWKDLAANRRVVEFGLQDADVTASYQLRADGLDMQVSVFDECFELSLSLMGKHNVQNVLAAIAVATAANIPCETIAAGLNEYQPIGGRLNVLRINERVLIDDTYNANPASMQAAIETLAQFSNTTLILGDMGELGAASVQEHLHLGELASSNNIGRLFACGEFAEHSIKKFAGEAKSFPTQKELLEYLANTGVEAEAVLVKGSRSAKMENVVQQVKQLWAEQTDTFVSDINSKNQAADSSSKENA